MNRVLILTADAGFGHRSAANALAGAFAQQQQVPCTVEVLNPLDEPHVPAFLRTGQTDYDRLVRENPDLYRIGYQASEESIPSALIEGGATVLLLDVMRRLLQQHTPDLVMVTYPLYQSSLATLATLNIIKVPFVTVVTDLSAVHRVWFNRAVAMLAVPTMSVRDSAFEHGVAENKIHVTGIPINPAIATETRSKAEIRRELGWEEDRPVVLAVGSKRVQHMGEMLHVINHAGLPVQLVVVAGGDDAQYHQLLRVEWHTPAHIYNYVTNLPTLMRAADIIMCKAGGLIVTEALACGLPLLLTEIIPGQETGNADYVVQNNAGHILTQPADALEILYHWLVHEPGQLERYSQQAAKLGRPHAALDIVHLALQLSGEHVR